jgi:putative mycofactocin binding protein MftB
MPTDTDHKYRLAKGTQVREEDFGLLFYTQQGPRLYFLPSGGLLNCGFFRGERTLSQWLEDGRAAEAASAGRLRSLRGALSGLSRKGVVIEF